MYSNPRYANSDGGILLEQENGVDLYVDSGPLHEAAIAGEFGQIAPPPAEPSAEELLQQEREGMVVSRFQARAALYQAGLLEQVEAVMADPATDMLAVLAWQDAQEFRRLSSTINALQPALGLTDTQLDDLFRQAATIEA